MERRWITRKGNCILKTLHLCLDLPEGLLPVGIPIKILKALLPLERPRRRWEGNIRMELQEIGISTRNWVDLTQDGDYWRALVNAAFEPPGSIIYWVSEVANLLHLCFKGGGKFLLLFNYIFMQRGQVGTHCGVNLKPAARKQKKSEFREFKKTPPTHLN